MPPRFDVELESMDFDNVYAALTVRPFENRLFS